MEAYRVNGESGRNGFRPVPGISGESLLTKNRFRITKEVLLKQQMRNEKIHSEPELQKPDTSSARRTVPVSSDIPYIFPLIISNVQYLSY